MSDTFDIEQARALADETQARADKATKGPWHIHEGDLVNIDHKDVFEDWEEAYGPNGDEVGPDTAFILAAREDVPTLTASLRAACVEIERLRKFIMLETEQCPKSHVGGPCGQCNDRRAALKEPHA